MSFDIPQMHIPDNSAEARVLEAIIIREHVTLEEAVRRAIRGTGEEQAHGQVGKMRASKSRSVSPLTEAEIKQIDKMFPALDALDDITEEQWSRIDKNIRRVKHAGLSQSG